MNYYKPPTSPCKDCQDRSPECHATCEAYAVFAVRQDEYRRAKIERHEEETRKYTKKTARRQP